MSVVSFVVLLMNPADSMSVEFLNYAALLFDCTMMAAAPYGTKMVAALPFDETKMVAVLPFGETMMVDVLPFGETKLAAALAFDETKLTAGLAFDETKMTADDKSQ